MSKNFKSESNKESDRAGKNGSDYRNLQDSKYLKRFGFEIFSFLKTLVDDTNSLLAKEEKTRKQW